MPQPQFTVEEDVLRRLALRPITSILAVSGFVPTAWREALLASLPPLLASLLFGLRLTGRAAIDGAGLALVGLLIVAGCLAVALLTRARRGFSRLTAAATAGSLGLVVPTFAILLPLAHRALLDPAAIVLAPAGIALLLFVAGLLGATAAVLSLHPAAPYVPIALLPTAALTIWAVPLLWRPEEGLVSGAVAFTFALTAVAWFAAGIMRGWVAAAPAMLALVITWVAALAVSRQAVPVAGPAGMLPAMQVALALAASILPLVIPAALQSRRGRAGEPPPASPPDIPA